MENEGMKKVQEGAPMIGGDGPQSYLKNSSIQKAAVDAAKGLMSEGIREKFDFENPCFNNLATFRIADFGCSTGPNTFFAVNNIIEAVEAKYHTQLQSSPPLEFHVFFSDLNSNDFNILFRTLSSYQKYFAAGVPGSFYARLFPKSFIHFAHSSCSLNWLSKVPKEIVDSTSPAWNKGSIHCTGLSKEVADAYLVQYKYDLNNFLNARAEEIVSGGLMALLIAGRPDGVHMYQTYTGALFDMLGSCLIDLANLGEISEEEVDSFNLPTYFSSLKETEDILEGNGFFSIERMEEMVSPTKNTKPSVELSASRLRAVFEGVVRQHFRNEDLGNRLFQHFANKLAENYSTFDQGLHRRVDLFVLLKRNTY